MAARMITSFTLHLLRADRTSLITSFQPPLLSGSAVNNFFDQGNFDSEAMKTLSGWEAARCDEHQFRAKIKVST